MTNAFLDASVVRRGGLAKRRTASVLQLLFEKAHDLVVAFLGGTLVSRSESISDARFEVVSGDLTSHGLQGLLDRMNLIENVATVSVLTDHPLESPDLSLYSAESRGEFVLVGIANRHEKGARLVGAIRYGVPPYSLWRGLVSGASVQNGG